MMTSNDDVLFVPYYKPTPILVDLVFSDSEDEGQKGQIVPKDDLVNSRTRVTNEDLARRSISMPKRTAQDGRVNVNRDNPSFQSLADKHLRLGRNQFTFISFQGNKPQPLCKGKQKKKGNQRRQTQKLKTLTLDTRLDKMRPNPLRRKRHPSDSGSAKRYYETLRQLELKDNGSNNFQKIPQIIDISPSLSPPSTSGPVVGQVSRLGESVSFGKSGFDRDPWTCSRQPPFAHYMTLPTYQFEINNARLENNQRGSDIQYDKCDFSSMKLDNRQEDGRHVRNEIQWEPPIRSRDPVWESPTRVRRTFFDTL